MSERLQPNTFERLGQGSQARRAKIDAAFEAQHLRDEVLDDETVVLENSRGTFFSKLGESFSNLIKPVNGRVAAPVGMVILTIAAACSGGGKDKQGEVGGSEDFSDNLPIELFDACRAYVESETVGGEGDRKGLALAAGYFEEHVEDDRALYLAAAGSAFIAEFDVAREAFLLLSEEGKIPSSQKNIAKEMVEGLDKFLSAEGKTLDDPEELDEALDALFEPMGKLRGDFENNICSESEPIDVGDEVDSRESTLKDLFNCAIEGDVGCQNEFIQFRTEAVDVILKEVLNEDIEHEYVPGAFAPLDNIFNGSADMLFRIYGGEPEAVEGAFSKIVQVLECSTHSPCSIDIAGKDLNLASGDVEKPIGQNALNFVKTIAFWYPPQDSIDLVAPHLERLRGVQEWVEQRVSPTNSQYALINGNLKEIILYLEEQLDIRGE